MLSEFALSPAIFRTDSYENESSAVADLCLRAMGPPLLEDCIVRNLHGGDWFRQIDKCRDSLHPKAKELIKKLDKQNRLVVHDSIAALCPENDEDWEREAIASNVKTPLAGMIFSRESKANNHRDNDLVECPEKLSSATFWRERPCSKRIPRTIEEYGLVLLPLLRRANSIAFIDPHLNPAKPTRDQGYMHFIKLLTHPALANRGIKPPKIEVHRVAWAGDGRDIRPKCDEIEGIFRKNWADELNRSAIKIEVFLWEDFHDRFVCTDLLAMNWSNGFDTTSDPSAKVTVSRLSRKDLDNLQLEFAQNSNIHRLQRKFVIG